MLAELLQAMNNANPGTAMVVIGGLILLIIVNTPPQDEPEQQ